MDRGPAEDAAPPTPDPAVDRVAAFAAGPQKIPLRIVVVVVAAMAVLGLGGVVADHFFGGPVGTATTATTEPGAYPPPLPTTPAPGPGETGPGASPSGSELPASVSALMGLSSLPATTAPGFSLTDTDGRGVSLAGLRGKVVVLTFFDAACDDVCPVLATELVHADAQLGSAASRVVLLTVDTDPLALAKAAAAPAEAAAGISTLPNWMFLSGSLGQLDAVWKSYGVAVEVQPSTRRVAHNDVLYLIDPSGRLRLRAVPFADESASGAYSLPAPTEESWATGIADEARSLLPASP